MRSVQLSWFHFFSSINEVAGVVGIKKEDTEHLQYPRVLLVVAAHWAAPEMMAPVDRTVMKYGRAASMGHRHGVLGN